MIVTGKILFALGALALVSTIGGSSTTERFERARSPTDLSPIPRIVCREPRDLAILLSLPAKMQEPALVVFQYVGLCDRTMQGIPVDVN